MNTENNNFLQPSQPEENQNSETINLGPADSKYEQNDNIDSCMGNTSSKQTSNNKKPKKHFASYIIIGLVCSVIGGAASSAASLYLLPKTSMFQNTPLYKSLQSNYTPDSAVSSKNGSYATPTSTKTTGLTVAEIAKKVGPAVVGVSTTEMPSGDGFFSDNSPQQGMGSGIIFNQDGYILTNYHVVQGAQQIKVILSGSTKEYNAKVINYDANLDVAVIKVTDKVKMPAVAELGNSKDMQVGDSVVAIGNPLGKELLGTVTTGVISAVNRQITVGNTNESFLQTDAAINPGNSGGALVNSLGQVIGINSAKINGNGVEGIGFAIPIDTIKPKIDSLLKPILKIGIAARDIDNATSKQYNIPKGVYVVQVEQFSAAEKAGIQPGDVIVKFDGKNVSSVNEINTIKSTHKSGDVVKIEANRNGKNVRLSLKLSE
ncbi:trypsin-like peptidase domain-containing protein [Clostridium sp. JN-9]|uniref:S1C family serine protease n=1 Tax=Clostridium sp. JN-9 TaxID=2507159 RepID=UPI0026ABDAFC